MVTLGISRPTRASRQCLRTLAGLLLVCTIVAGCTAPYDNDGELIRGDLAAAPGGSMDARTIVIDTDLGGQDLVAMAFLLRHPAVRVAAVTIPATGIVGCDLGVDLVADLFTALDEDPVPVACGRAGSGPGGRVYPESWREASESGRGLARSPSTLPLAPEPAADLLGRLAHEHDGLVVVALGPLTNLAHLAADSPASYARVAMVHAVAGSIDGPLPGLGELNAAADPKAFATVLHAAAPLTLLPVDVVPTGTLESLRRAPVVGQLALPIEDLPWWDLAAAVSLVAPDAAQLESGSWAQDAAEPSWLRRDGQGSVRVVRHLNVVTFEAEVDAVFVTE